MAGTYPDGRGKPGSPKGCGLTYDEEKFTALMDRISGGESLRGACEELGLSPATVLRWVTNDEPPGTAKRYARANESKMLIWADDIISISDDATNDVKILEDGTVVNVAENVQRSKLRADNRKWLMARMGDRFFSETRKHELSGPGGGPIETTELTPEEKKRRLKELGYAENVLED